MTDQEMAQGAEAPAGSSSPAETATGRRKRTARPFPASSFEDALDFAKAIYDFASGQPVRRLSLFDHLKKSPDSGASRQLIVNANKYGLTRGSYSAEQLEITPDCAQIFDEAVSERDRASAKIKLAIMDIPVFRSVYEKFVGKQLPARAALSDSMKEVDVPPDAVNEGVDTFIVNLRFVGLLQTLSGAERIVTVDHVLSALDGVAAKASQAPAVPAAPAVLSEGKLVTQERAQFETTCFYVTPIGDDGSEARKHSDLFLSSIIEPALEPFGLKVIRADAIDKPGMITRQIIEYLLRSRLVIADLSFHNPNVFYEIALRHAARLPVVQIIRFDDKIPFDVGQMRTIVIDNRDIYTLVPKIETYRSEIASHVRRALETGAEVDNPLSQFPEFLPRAT